MSQLEENNRKVFAEQLKTIIKRWEEAKGEKLSQQKLADSLFVSRETVSRWVNSRNTPLDDEVIMTSLCDFFSVPRAYFSKYNYGDGWTFIDIETHKNLNENCKAVAERIGLRPSFVSLLKDVPEFADYVIQVSWVDGLMQSISPDVAAIPEHLYQFVSSTGVKIYPPDDVLYMLRVIQRDTEEYMKFLFSKYCKEYDNYCEQVKKITKKSKNHEVAVIQRRGGTLEVDSKSGEEYPKKPLNVFSDTLRGQEGLSIDEIRVLELYRTISEEGKDVVFDTIMQERKKHPSKRTKAIKTAVRKAIKTKESVLPVSETSAKEE